MLRLALLALAGTSACQRKEKCELNLPALATKKVPALLSYTSSKDTLAFVSGGQLTLYGQLLPTTRINFGGAVEVLSTDATAIPFFVGIYHRLIAPSPQALLRVRISSPKVVLIRNRFTPRGERTASRRWARRPGPGLARCVASRLCWSRPQLK